MKKWNCIKTGIIIISMMILANVGFAQWQIQTSENIRLGDFFYENGIADEALSYFELALREGETIPVDSLSYLHYALSSDYYSRAIELLEEGLEKIPDKELPEYKQMAEELKKQKYYLNQWNYTEPSQNVKDGDYHYRLGNYYEAVNRYEFAISKDELGDGYLYYIQSLRKIGQERKAEELLKKHVIDPLIDKGPIRGKRAENYGTVQRELLDIYLKQGKITLKDIKDLIGRDHYQNLFGPGDRFFNHYMIFCFREKKYQEVLKTICEGIFEGRASFDGFWGIRRGSHKPEPLLLMIKYEFISVKDIIKIAEDYIEKHPDTEEGLRAKFLAAEMYYPLLQNYEKGLKLHREIASDERSRQIKADYFKYDLYRLYGDGPYIIKDIKVTFDYDVTVSEVCQKRVEEIVKITSEPILGKLAATVDIKPDTLNLKSEQKRLTCYIELPERYNVADIDVSTIMLNDEFYCKSSPAEIGDYDKDGIFDLMVEFDREEIKSLLSPPEVTLTVTGIIGELIFWGQDTIEVIDKKIIFSFKEFKIKDMTIHFREKPKKADFTLTGRFQLPEEYKKEDLEKQASIKLNIAKLDNKWLTKEESVEFNERGQIWFCQLEKKIERNENSLNIEKMIIFWYPEKDDSKKHPHFGNWFFIKGNFIVDEQEKSQLLPKTEITLSMPIQNIDIPEKLEGKDEIEFKTHKNMWHYHLPHKWPHWKDSWWEKIKVKGNHEKDD